MGLQRLGTPGAPTPSRWRARLLPWAMLMALSGSLSGMAQAATMTLPDFATTARTAGPGVVRIKALQHQSALPNNPIAARILDRFDQEPGIPPLAGDKTLLGSGFIWSVDGTAGEVVTNRHVVDGADWVEVRLSDGRDLPAKVIGTDEATDIAVLKVQAPGLHALPRGDSRQLEPGQWVMAIGAPFGFDHSVTVGVVSAVDRSSGSEDATQPLTPFIQTDVAINHGNSGGPLLNAQGQVVGINARILSTSGGYMGISLAIPIEVADHVVQDLVEQGTVTRGWWGIQAQDLNAALAEALGAPSPYGAVLTRVAPHSPAEAAGLKLGDTIVRLDGQPIQGFGDLAWRSGLKRPQDTLHVDYIRQGTAKTTDVQLAPLPNAHATPVDTSDANPVVATKGVLTVVPLTAAEASAAHVTGPSVRVTQVSTAAQRAGLAVNDIVLAVNDVPQGSSEAFTHALQGGKRYAALLVLRSGARQFVALPTRPSDADVP